MITEILNQELQTTVKVKVRNNINNFGNDNKFPTVIDFLIKEISIANNLSTKEDNKIIRPILRDSNFL